MRISTAMVTALALTLPALPAGAAGRVPLHRVASIGGYRYSWSPDTSALVLSRPGTVVVLRPGAALYQVNEHDEVAAPAPVFSDGDLYVSPDLAAHLERLAKRSSALASAGTATAPDRPAQGAITLEARQLQGDEAIAVDGTAPAGLPVTITVLAVVSPDIPTIVVSRHDVAADVNGRFGAVIPIASAYERGIIFKVVATSAPGVASAQAQVITGAPNAGVSVPLDTTH